MFSFLAGRTRSGECRLSQDLLPLYTVTYSSGVDPTVVVKIGAWTSSTRGLLHALDSMRIQSCGSSPIVLLFQGQSTVQPHLSGGLAARLWMRPWIVYTGDPGSCQGRDHVSLDAEFGDD